MKRAPQPPTARQLEDEARAWIEKIGGRLPESVEDRVVAAITRWWEERGTPPVIVHIARELGIPAGSASGAVISGIARGRLVRLAPKVIAPVPSAGGRV